MSQSSDFQIDERRSEDSGNAVKVRKFLRLLEAGRIDAWGELWAENGRQDMPFAPPDFPSGIEGRSRLIEHFSKLAENFEYMRFPDLKVHETTDPNLVIAEFRGDIQVRGGGRKYDNRYINLFEFNNVGLISRVVEYFNPLILIDADAFSSTGVPGGAALTARNTQNRSVDLEQWARTFFATVDTRDPDAIAAYFGDEVELAFGNRPPIRGKEAVRDSFKATASALDGVRHDITGLWAGTDGNSQVISVEALVTYTLSDKRQVTVPCTSTLRLHRGLIAGYRIFIDTTPVFGPDLSGTPPAPLDAA